VDKDLKELFAMPAGTKPSKDQPLRKIRDVVNRKATIVIEHIIQASMYPQ
jgi:hypothetical protein